MDNSEVINTITISVDGIAVDPSYPVLDKPLFTATIFSECNHKQVRQPDTANHSTGWQCRPGTSHCINIVSTSANRAALTFGTINHADAINSSGINVKMMP